MIVFPEPRGAVEWAVLLQLALLRQGNTTACSEHGLCTSCTIDSESELGA